MTDKELIDEMQNIETIMQVVGDLRKAQIIKDGVALVDRLTTERDQARRDCAVAESNHQTAVNDFKTALLKKIFPYDVADKKQYSINAYAVERAIVEVAEQMTGG